MNVQAVWKLPAPLAVGQLGDLELREADGSRCFIPRPGEERLGPLAVRAVAPLAEGRGWRITVQPMAPGTAVIPPMDLGDGRRSPELRLVIPRTAPYGAAWMGVGGGQQDVLPAIDFPWAWTTLLALPLAALGYLLARRLRRGRPARRRKAARRAFSRQWPPDRADRACLDAAHEAGRDLLAAIFGEDTRGWGPEAFEERRLEVWSRWLRSLDAARFARLEPAFPDLAALLAALEGR